MPQQLAASELSCEQSLLDKALKEFVEKIDKAEDLWKTNVNDTDREEQDTGRETPKCLKNMHGRNFKRIMMNFQ